MKHVTLCIPCYGEWKADFCMDVIALFGEFPETQANLIGIGIEYVRSSMLPQARQMLAQTAVLRESTHALFLDTDMRFPKDTILRLLKHDKDIVGANYTQRIQPHQPTACKGDKRLSSLGRSGLEEVDGLGFGVCMIKTEVLAKMELPLFMFGYRAKTNEFVGEDIWFFNRARDKGFKVFVDHDLSQEVRHIGEVELDVDMSAIG